MRYQLIVTTAVIFGMVASVAGHEFAEVDAGEYRAVRRVFKSAGPVFQHRAALAMDDGLIRRWEYDGLRRIAATEHVALDGSGKEGSVVEDKVVLMAMTRQINAHGGAK